MARLSPRFNRLLEAHLAQERVSEALSLLLAALKDESGPGADTLRYLAATGLIAGYTEKATTILERALDEALADRDLVGAIDILRRLDALGGDVERWWTKTLASVVKRGFEKVDASPALLGPTDETPDDAPTETLFMECLDLVIQAEPSTAQTPFHFVPLLSDLSDGDLRAAVKSLDIRLVPEGKPLQSVCEGSPAWVVSGTVLHAESEIPLPSGTLVLPAEDGPLAASPTRLLVFDPDVWKSLEGDSRVERALGDYARKHRLTGALRASTFFRSLPSDARVEFVALLNCTTIVDEPIIIRGYSVRGLFVMLSGQAVVTQQDGDTRIEIARLQPGDVFGELDVLTAGGAEYDVHAEGEVEICFVDAQTARDLLRGAPDARSHLVELRETRQRESLAVTAPTSDKADKASI